MIPELAKRLGVVSEKAIWKAQEYERLLHLKTAASGFQIQGVAQMILCLDLAVGADNQTLDRELSLKLAGLKKTAYNIQKQTLKQILGLVQDLTIKDICVQLGCPEMISEVENLLEKYCQHKCNGQPNFDHPGFKAAAVMAISKVKKLGVNRLRLHEISGLRKSVFDKLVLSMIALKKEVNEENVSKVKTTKRTHTFVEAVEAKAKALDDERNNEDADKELPQVDFAAWKRRMLEEAKRQ